MTEAISWKYRRSFLTPRNDRLEPGFLVQALNKISAGSKKLSRPVSYFFGKASLFSTPTDKSPVIICSSGICHSCW